MSSKKKKSQDKLTKSPKMSKSPLIQSSFDKQTFLPPQLELEPSASVAIKSKIEELEGELDRYHVFVNETNSYSHIISLFISLKGLNEVVYTNMVRHTDAVHLENEGCSDCFMQVTKMRIKDFAITMKNLFQTEMFPVPLLYDIKLHQILSTDSAVICKFLNEKFNHLSECQNPELDLCPQEKKIQKKMKKVERRVLGKINQCIGRAGRAASMEQFQSSGEELHEGLREMESILDTSKYLCGDEITEADVLEFVPLFRYDPLYSWTLLCDGHRTLIKHTYPNIWGWLCDIYQQPGVSDTCDIIEILNSNGFLQSFGARVVELDIEFEINWDLKYGDELSQPHDRAERFAKSEGEGDCEEDDALEDDIPEETAAPESGKKRRH